MQLCAHIEKGSGPVAAFCAASILAACAPATSDMIELRNVAWWKVIPKSSPKQLIEALDKYCFAVNRQTAASQLKSDDYVAVPGRKAIQSYVVADKRPLVMLSDTGAQYGCAVAAEARTGQRNRVEAFVENRAGGAVTIKTEPSGDAYWKLGTGEIVFFQRTSAAGQIPQVMVGVHRAETQIAQRRNQN